MRRFTFSFFHNVKGEFHYLNLGLIFYMFWCVDSLKQSLWAAATFCSSLKCSYHSQADIVILSVLQHYRKKSLQTRVFLFNQKQLLWCASEIYMPMSNQALAPFKGFSLNEFMIYFNKTKVTDCWDTVKDLPRRFCWLLYSFCCVRKACYDGKVTVFINGVWWTWQVDIAAVCG